jgi:hypothetical protein
VSGREPERPEDAAWQEIVDNFGDRAELGADETVPAEQPEAEQPLTSRLAHLFGDDVDEPFGPADDAPEFGAFVPPEPEPLTLTPIRTAAWAGVLGAPVLALLWVIVSRSTSWGSPSWVALLLAGAFLAGFGYLVATMPKERDDPYDDGARL